MNNPNDPVEMGYMILRWFWGGWFFAYIEAGTQALDNIKKDHLHTHGRIVPHR